MLTSGKTGFPLDSCCHLQTKTKTNQAREKVASTYFDRECVFGKLNEGHRVVRVKAITLGVPTCVITLCPVICGK